MTGFFKNLFLYSAGHTYSNLSRLFLRLGYHVPAVMHSPDAEL